MKKYEKPIAVIENYMFVQTIAAGCSVNVPSENVSYKDGMPVWDMGGGNILFDSGSGVCTMDGSEMVGACYNNLGTVPSGGGAFVS